ncbi:MAG: hypothetical protein E6J52_00205 [Chloroflexi bacterium]|nr:MAG: hypothetical protein E6J52_00205 [Chloroflexota bacterium]
MGDPMTLYRREFLRRSALAAASAAVLACTPGGAPGATAARPSAGPVRGGTLTWGQWDKIDLITAAAVKGSFERILDPKLKAGAVVSLAGPIDTITAPNDSTVIFTFKQGYPAFMLQIWRYFFGILSPKYLATLKPGDQATEPVGSGPFKFVSRSSDGVVTLKAFPDYKWGPETFKNRAAPWLDTVKFRAITEPSTRIATLESGENLLIDEIPETDYARLKDDKRFTFVLSPRASHTLGFSMNVTKAPTDDRAVREAVNWAIDRKTIVDKVFFGVHHVSVGPLSEGVWARDDTIEKMFAFDPARAKKLLDDAGWKLGTGPIRQKGGQNLEILLATFRSPWTDIAQAMQAQLRDVGIDLKVQVMERGPYLDYVRAYKHNMAATSSTAIDPDGILRVCYHSANRGGGSNFSNVADPALDALLVKGQAQELNTAERRQTYLDAQKKVMEILPLPYRQGRQRVGRPRVTRSDDRGDRPARSPAHSGLHRRAHPFRQRRGVALPHQPVRGARRTRGARGRCVRRETHPRRSVDLGRRSRGRICVGCRCGRQAATGSDAARHPCARRRHARASGPASPRRWRVHRELAGAGPRTHHAWRAGSAGRSHRTRSRDGRADRRRPRQSGGTARRPDAAVEPGAPDRGRAGRTRRPAARGHHHHP